MVYIYILGISAIHLQLELGARHERATMHNGCATENISGCLTPIVLAFRPDIYLETCCV